MTNAERQPPVSADCAGAASPSTSAGLTAATVGLIRRLRTAADWHTAIGSILEGLGEALGCHRALLLRLRETPDQGFVELTEAVWTDKRFGDPAIQHMPTRQEEVTNDPFLRQMATNGRKAAMFAGHTRTIPGYLHAEFTRQKIKSFLSFPVFVHGHLWGGLGVNDCMAERDWTPDEIAAVELLSFAIGNAIDRQESDVHVSDVIRTAMLENSLDAVVMVDEAGSDCRVAEAIDP